MADVFLYRVQHDRGLAPNPFFGVCTLAVCMARIRRVAQLGDVIIGTASHDHPHDGSRPAGGNAVYVMRVTGETDFDRYYRDHPEKRAVMNGSRLRGAGDAFYHVEDGEWVQDNSLHSLAGGGCSKADLKADVLAADRILTSTDFTYWGDKAPALPPGLVHFGAKYVRYQCNFAAADKAALIAWADQHLGQGRIGMPIDWRA